MTAEKFLKKLHGFYRKIPGTNLCCKYYMQTYTFSFELHDTRKQCFTPDSKVFDSDVYWWQWNSKSEMLNIISSIKSKAIAIDKKLKS